MFRIPVTLCASALLLAPVPVAPLVFASAAAAQGGQRDDQARARAEMKAGRNMSIDEIERRIIPRMGKAEYLGFEYDRAAGAYRLKFIDNGQVIWVDVDAQTARVLRISR